MAETTTPTATPDAEVKTDKKSKPDAKTRQKPKQLPPYNVVLLNDNDHTYQYVIEMLRALFGHNEQQGYQLAKQVDRSGRAIVMTTHKELAELKRDQIACFGSDVRVAT